jgi:hypothetical protein
MRKKRFNDELIALKAHSLKLAKLDNTVRCFEFQALRRRSQIISILSIR